MHFFNMFRKQIPLEYLQHDKNSCKVACFFFVELNIGFITIFFFVFDVFDYKMRVMSWICMQKQKV